MAMFMSRRDDAVAERQGQECQERSGQGDVGPQAKEQMVGVGGDDVFLDEQLHAVGECLQPAEFAADACGAKAVLDAAGDLAFQPHRKNGIDEHESPSGLRRRQAQAKKGSRRTSTIFENFDNSRHGTGSSTAVFANWPSGLVGVTVWAGSEDDKMAR